MTSILPYARSYLLAKAVLTSITMVAVYLCLTTPSFWPTVNQLSDGWSGTFLSPRCSSIWRLVSRTACMSDGVAVRSTDRSLFEEQESNHLVLMPMIKLAVVGSFAPEVVFLIPCLAALTRRRSLDRHRVAPSICLSDLRAATGVSSILFVFGYMQFCTPLLRDGTGIYALYFELFTLLLFLNVALGFLFAFAFRAYVCLLSDSERRMLRR